VNWLRANLVLVSGIVLPVLLVTGFLVLQRSSSLALEPPTHDFLVAGFRHDSQRAQNYRVAFEVRDGQLLGQASPLGEDEHVINRRQDARLYRYSATTRTFSEVPYEVPQAADGAQQEISFPIEALAGVWVDRSARSPDGYVFENVGYRSRGGLLGEVFGMGRRADSPYVLNRDGSLFDLPAPAGQSYYYGQDLVFLGWVSAEAELP
jgi:hypothetical protein